MIPESGNVESSNGYSAKKRRSFIPTENNLGGGVISESDDKETKEHSGEESSVASGNSQDSKKVYKPEGSGAEPGTIYLQCLFLDIRHLFKILLTMKNNRNKRHLDGSWHILN